jgi:hypothetical protein
MQNSGSEISGNTNSDAKNPSSHFFMSNLFFDIDHYFN